MPSTYRHIGEAAPYYDDYVGSKHDDKGYVKVLWKPSRAVQARELTQMQTYSQNQIASLGGYLFKDGTVVQGGVISTTTKQKYFVASVTYPAGMSLEDAMAGFMSNNKISTNDNAANSEQGLYPIGIGKIKFQIVGWTTLYDAQGGLSLVSGMEASKGMTSTKVIVFYNLLGGSFATFDAETGMLNFLDNDGVGLTFSNPVAEVNSTLTVQSLLNLSASKVSDVYKTCTCASCTQGTIFVDGYFVNCPMTSLMINPITTVKNEDTGLASIDVVNIDNDDVEYNVGFWIERKIVDASEDETLTDPAGGTYNHKAPGADRYSILAHLKCFSSKEIDEMIKAGENILQVNSTSDIEKSGGATKGIKFAGGIVVKNNIVIKEQSNIGTNSALMDEMARRTYEESGNYTVRPWKIQLSEKTAIEDNGVKTVVPDEYTVSIGPGLGYIYGYRVSTCISQTIDNTKARTSLLRTGNSKFTDRSMYVLSDDIYTFNNSSSAPSRNVASWHIENVMAASKVYMIDRAVGEMLKSYSNDLSSWNVAHPLELQDDDKITKTSIESEILGSCSVIDVSSDGWHNLKISVLNVEGVTNISDVSSIVSFDSAGALSGYVDLLHDGEGGTTVWKNVESPLIFELDWRYVAPSSDTMATFVCNAFVSSETPAQEAPASNGNPAYVYVTFLAPASIKSPATSRSVNFLLDETTGEIIPASKVIVDDGSTDASFNINEIARGTLTAGHTYSISYQGDGKVVASSATSNNSSTERKFKEKKLAIGTMTMNATDIATLLAGYASGGSEKDVIVLRDGKSYIADATGLSSDVFVTDLVKVLAIERIEGTTIDNNQTNSVTSEELFWKTSNGLESSITIFNGCTDYRYESPTISGLAAWLTRQEESVDSISFCLKITFAYWKHLGSGSFFYAGSYGTDASAEFIATDSVETDSADVFKQRLAQFYGVTSIRSTTNDAYRLIPKYKSAAGAMYDLTNCIDFRPDWDPLVFSENTSASETRLPVIPLPESRVEYDIATYLPRIDSVWIDKNGKFEITKGIPSDSPIPPEEKDGTMVIYNIYNQPYGKTLNEIVLQYKDNRRHTMVDITAIAERLSSLEEIVSLSMSEQAAVNMQIMDEDGSARYKCGVFTDSFSTFGGCDFTDENWNATIDSVEQCVRAGFDLRDWSFSPTGIYILNNGAYELETLKLVSETSTTQNDAKCEVFGKSASTAGNGTLMTGGTILTIAPVENPYWETEGCPSPYSWTYAKNDMATESTNLQAMMFVVWNGNLVLTPAIDTWTNDLGEIVTESWEDEDANRPPDTYRSWTVTSYGTTTEKTERRTIPSGMTVAQIDATYGTYWGNVPVEQRLTHVNGGWWEPATTISDVTTYKTITSTEVTEKTTYIGSYEAKDTKTYMEAQDEFMRVRSVKFELEGMRPNQMMRAKMDTVPLKFISVEDFSKPNESDRTYTDTVTIKDDGTYIGYFMVPENMPVGTKLVEFYDDEQTTTASADYTANGKTIWVDVDRKYIRVWTAETSETMGASSTELGEKIKTETISEATLIRHKGDPIAESFYIEEPNGITLESIQVFFATKDPSVGVEIFIVECENGFPGQTMVPFSRVFIPASDVTVVSKEEFEKGNPTPTTFKFSVPLHLQGLTEYAFVVYAPSYNYEIYTSTLGKADFATGIGVKEQPYVGSMFKSQNLRTWTEEQISDIAFRMYRYKFPTGVKCYADFSLDDLITKNTGLPSTLPETGQSGEGDNEFAANAATISAGTYMPNSTSIDFSWYSGTGVGNAKPIINKQDIFFEDRDGFSINNKMESVSGTNDSLSRFKNINSSFKIRAALSTNDPNIAPQIDLEDFHGIFTRNKIDTSGEPVETINGLKYYDAGTYLSNTITLKNPAIGINVAVNAMLPNYSLIKAYLKTTATSRASKGFWTPSLGENDYVLYRDLPAGESGTEENYLLPGFQEYSWQEICNKRLYLWYYVQDSGDSETKFILPNQEAYGNDSISRYSHSSCIFKNVSTKSADILADSLRSTSETPVDTKAKKIILQDPVNLEIIPNPTSYSIKSDASATGGSRMAVVNYSSTNMSTNCKVYGVVAIPNIGPFDPDNLPAAGIDANYKGIFCGPYEEDRSYRKGEVCLFNGSIWQCAYNDVDAGLSPSQDAVYWTRIPCALIVSSLQDEITEEAQWVELDVNEYTNSTEREKSFMEYNYSLASSLESNEFDSYILKFRMLSLNSKDIPRFRNLRAVAVY